MSPSQSLLSMFRAIFHWFSRIPFGYRQELLGGCPGEWDRIPAGVGKTWVSHRPGAISGKHFSGNAPSFRGSGVCGSSAGTTVPPLRGGGFSRHEGLSFDEVLGGVGLRLGGSVECNGSHAPHLIDAMSPTGLSLGTVASPHCRLPFHPVPKGER
jgi:hypothetical protein